jgi:hypothetical protein
MEKKHHRQKTIGHVSFKTEQNQLTNPNNSNLNPNGTPIQNF